MIRLLFFIVLLAAWLTSCGQDAPTPTSAESVGERKQVEIPEGALPRERLKANGIPEADVAAKVKYSLAGLQELYKKAEGKVEGVGKVEILLDDQLNLIVKNNLGGDTWETMVNMKNLSPAAKDLKIIADNKGSAPGFQMFTPKEKTGVTVSKNGSKDKEQDFIEIRLADRNDVEKAVGIMLSAVQMAQGKL